MSNRAPPWREITTEDFHPRIFPDTGDSAQWIASSRRCSSQAEFVLTERLPC